MLTTVTTETTGNGLLSRRRCRRWTLSSSGRLSQIMPRRRHHATASTSEVMITRYNGVFSNTPWNLNCSFSQYFICFILLLLLLSLWEGGISFWDLYITLSPRPMPQNNQKSHYLKITLGYWNTLTWITVWPYIVVIGLKMLKYMKHIFYTEALFKIV